ncbi:MAG: recombinase family protein [Bacteroidota bacterium]
MKKVVLFCRVSSTNDRQSYDRQVNDLTQYANTNNYEVAAVFAEKISGSTRNSARPELNRMIEFVNSNPDVEKVLCTELSRVGRDPLQVLQTIETLNQASISLYIQNYNIETLTADKEVNPLAQFLITILAEISRMEKSAILNRLRSGYDNHLKNNGDVGRKRGYRKSTDQMKNQYAEEIKLIGKDYSYSHISQLTGTNKNTLTKLKQMFLN